MYVSLNKWKVVHLFETNILKLEYFIYITIQKNTFKK